jgi:hypothetical protein
MKTIQFLLFFLAFSGNAFSQNTDQFAYHTANQLSDTSYSIKKANGDSTIFLFEGSNSSNSLDTTYVSKSVADATYAFVNGKSGGQALNGGTGSGDNLTLSSTSNASKGHINFGNYSYYDEATGTLVLANSDNTHHMFLNPQGNIFGMQVNGIPSDFEIVGNSIEFHTNSNSYFNSDVIISNSHVLYLDNNNGSLYASTYVDSASNQWLFNLHANWVFKINSTNGNVGVGDVNEASARLEVQSSDGTGGSAPIKLRAGTLLTTIEDGTVEYDGTNYYVTSGNTRYILTRTLTGTTAPLTTPQTVGIQFIDTANKKIYVSTGTSSSFDWTILN